MLHGFFYVQHVLDNGRAYYHYSVIMYGQIACVNPLFYHIFITCDFSFCRRVLHQQNHGMEGVPYGFTQGEKGIPTRPIG